METKLYGNMTVRGSDFLMTISQYSTGSVIDRYMTEIVINKFDTLGEAKDQKKFVFTQEEFEMFIECLEINDKKYSDDRDT
jgi:hypothetical protein